MKLISGIIVASFGLFFVLLAIAAVFQPTWTKRYLNAFASSARTHLVEQAVRLTGGIALIVFSTYMHFHLAWHIFGWVLAVTAVILAIVPWRIHNKFASWVVPFAIRHRFLYAGGSLVLGLLLLYSVSRDLL